MLSTVGRAAARRIITARIAPSTPQLLSHSVPAVAYRSAPVRAFAVSAWTRLPASKGTSKDPSKKSATKKATKKTASKKKTTKKADKPKPKPAPKKKAKKVLTPEEKVKEELRELKKWALLTKISYLPETAWSLYVSQEVKSGEKDIGSRMKEISVKFKELYSYEREDLEKTAQSNRVTNEANYKAWVESYPVERIYLANKARRRLARKTEKSIRPIRDGRLPKPTGGPYSDFVRAKFHSLDSNLALPDKMRELSEQWKNLSDIEKKTYQDSQQKELSQYATEMDKIKADAKELQKTVKTEEAAAKQQKTQARNEARRVARAAN